jgi:hypothetical protein
MRYIPRSHPNGVLEHGGTDVDGALGVRGEEVAVEIEEEAAVDAVLETRQGRGTRAERQRQTLGSFVRLSLEAWASVGLVQNAIWPH